MAGALVGLVPLMVVGEQQAIEALGFELLGRVIHGFAGLDLLLMAMTHRAHSKSPFMSDPKPTWPQRVQAWAEAYGGQGIEGAAERLLAFGQIRHDLAHHITTLNADEYGFVFTGERRALNLEKLRRRWFDRWFDISPPKEAQPAKIEISYGESELRAAIVEADALYRLVREAGAPG